MQRLFIAIPITLDSEFVALTDHLKAHTGYDHIVWTEAKVQHLTLRFLGETPDPQIEPLIASMGQILKDVHYFQLTIDKLGVFGSHYKPTTLWLGFQDFEVLRQIHERIEKVLPTIGFEADHGNFVPHITLGRIKNLANKNKFWQLFEQCQPTHTQTIDVNRIVLYRSKLRPAGPVYTEMAHWNLQQ